MNVTPAQAFGTAPQTVAGPRRPVLQVVLVGAVLALGAYRVALRRTHAARLTDGLRDLDTLRLPESPTGVEAAFYRYNVELRADLLTAGWDRDRVVAALVAEGVPATQGGCSEIQRERAFPTARTPPRVLPHATALTRTTFTLPVHHRRSNSDVDDVVAAVHKVLQEAAE